MGLFDGGLPKGVQMMLGNMMRDAAPQIVEQIDQFAQLVRDCKVQLDRIEAKLDAMEKYDGQRKSPGSEPIPVIGKHSGGNQNTLNGAGKPPHSDA
jgi:hypothetical protein